MLINILMKTNLDSGVEKGQEKQFLLIEICYKEE